jgi:hypothetical protein
MFINDHFEANFNAVLASAIFFQQPVIAREGGYYLQSYLLKVMIGLCSKTIRMF